MKKRQTIGFWEGETCEHCGGSLVEKQITLHRQINGRHVLFEKVPAGVCQKCGGWYFSANVLKTIQESLRGRRKPNREIPVQVFSL